jgi:hypothetical protein
MHCAHGDHYQIWTAWKVKRNSLWNKTRHACWRFRRCSFQLGFCPFRRIQLQVSIWFGWLLPAKHRSIYEQLLMQTKNYNVDAEESKQLKVLGGFINEQALHKASHLIQALEMVFLAQLLKHVPTFFYIRTFMLTIFRYYMYPTPSLFKALYRSKWRSCLTAKAHLSCLCPIRPPQRINLSQMTKKAEMRQYILSSLAQDWPNW